MLWRLSGVLSGKFRQQLENSFMFILMIFVTQREIPIQFHIGVVCLSKTQCEHIKYLQSYLLAKHMSQTSHPKSDRVKPLSKLGKSAELHNSNPSMWWSGRWGEGKRMRIVGVARWLVMDSYGDGKPVMPCYYLRWRWWFFGSLLLFAVAGNRPELRVVSHLKNNHGPQEAT